MEEIKFEDISGVVVKKETNVEEAETEQDVNPVVKEELHVKEEFIQGQNEQFVDQIFLQDINTIIKDEIDSEEVEKEDSTQEVLSFTPINKDICEEMNSTQECEQHIKNSLQNQSVSSCTFDLLKHCTPVHENKKHHGDVFTVTFTDHVSQRKLIHTVIKKCQCDICTKMFTRANSLSQYMVMRSDAKKYQCDICRKRFTRAGNLSEHKLIHAGNKMYQCDVCTNTYTRARYLSQHKLIHTGIKKYQCDICTKLFTQSSYLARHKLTHSDIKKYRCDVCAKKFTQSGSLSRHKSVVHDGIRNEPFNICKKLFP